jgi:hypothetical protein
MSRHGQEGEGTYRTVRDRFREWNDANPRPRSPSAIAMPELSEGASKMLGMVVGFGIGVTLLVLAVTAYVASGSWGELARSGARVAYFLTGFFLTVAGLGAIGATYNHVFRVLTRRPSHH